MTKIALDKLKSSLIDRNNNTKPLVVTQPLPSAAAVTTSFFCGAWALANIITHLFHLEISSYGNIAIGIIIIKLPSISPVAL